MSNPWLPTAPVITDARTRLFCLPYAGGGAAIYRPWLKAVPRSVQVCALQLPGRENRLTEPAFTSMDALIPALVEAIRAHLDRPFALFGHSMGALVAFELARALRRRHLPQPRHLFLSAHRAPHLPDRRPPIHQLDDDAFWEEMRRLEGTPQEVLDNEELKELVLPTLRADFQLCETWKLIDEEPLDEPFSIFGGTEDPNVDRDELESWRDYTSGAMTLRMLPGHHLFLQQAQSTVLDAVLEDLRKSGL
jgi:myxalamid-type polyketide synthase MxaE and MxaD/epothilone polyketide synthase D